MSTLRISSAFRTVYRSFSQATGSHTDFSRVVKNPAPTDVLHRIENQVKESPVVVYMKGLPSQPQCGFSWKVVQILNAIGVEYRAHNVLMDEELRSAVKKYSAWPTIPQLYVGGEFVGGSDIVEDMARKGELQKMIAGTNAVVGDQTSSS